MNNGTFGLLPVPESWIFFVWRLWKSDEKEGKPAGELEVGLSSALGERYL